MHPLSLVVFLTLAAGPDRPIPAGCREDHGTCREDCTIDYGGSTTKYRQLTACIQRCDKEQKECANRHYSLQDAQIDPLPERASDPAMREPEPYESLDKPSTVPASGKEPSGDPVRRGVYRAADEAPTEPAEPAMKPEPKPAATSKPAPEPSSESEEVPIFDKDEPEPEPVPKPAPKPAEPQRAPPPPEPKKKDISDWDPNGD